MCNWGKWVLPGLITVGLLTLLTGAMRSGPVEKDLASRTGTGLSAAHPWASVKLDGRDLVLEGTAPEPDAQTAALKIARDTYGVRVARDATKLLPLAEPYVFSAARDGNKVTLTGNIPLEELRTAVMQSVASAIPGAEIADQLVLSRGAPADFAGLAGFAMAQFAGLGQGNVSLSGPEVSASGTASTLDAWNELNARFSGSIPAGGKLGKVEILPPAVSPYIFSASKQADRLVLGGNVPDNAIRAALLDAAKAGGAQVEDKLVPASGASAGFADLAKFALGQFAMLKSGKAEISDADLALTGEAPTADSHAKLMEALSGTLPGGGRLASANIVKPAEFAWSYSRDAKGGVLEGFVPDEKTGGEILESAKASSLSGMTITDNQKVGEGAPSGFADAAKVLVRSVNRLFVGKAELNPSGVTVSGEAMTPAAAKELAASLPGLLPGGMVPKIEIAAAPSGTGLSDAECELSLKSVLAANRIQFETGSARIKGDSTPLLDMLTYTASQCPAAHFEIGGHTDADGGDAENLTLSNERAGAVTKYLADSGIDAARLIARGYGETVPVGDNNTDEGKAQNRRIEFRIIQ